MSCITRGIVRWGLISGLALGGITLLIGPERVMAGFAQIRSKAQHVVDRCVDDPVALRRQLQALADQYPDRIATVRGELAQVNHQITQFDRDTAVSERVVAMTSEDLAKLKTLVARAEAEKTASARPVSVRFNGSRFDLDEVYTEAARINKVRLSYQDRLASNRQQLTVLGEQKKRLTEIAAKLENEYTTFQTQMWQLDRQIDAIERNSRLIQMTEQLQATLDSYNKWGEIGNLKQLEGKLAELRAVQEAQLQSLSRKGVHTDYENKAMYELDSESGGGDPFKGIFDSLDPQTESNPTASPTTTSASVALLAPIVIE
jgi:phage shock protein A